MDVASPLDARQARGLALVQAKRAKIKHVSGSRWLVPSQTDASGGYVVDVEQNSCTCPDHEDRGVKCKHLWAIMILRAEVELPDGTMIVTEKRITYRQDWPRTTRRRPRSAIASSSYSAASAMASCSHRDRVAVARLRSSPTSSTSTRRR